MTKTWRISWVSMPRYHRGFQTFATLLLENSWMPQDVHAFERPSNTPAHTPVGLLCFAVSQPFFLRALQESVVVANRPCHRLPPFARERLSIHISKPCAAAPNGSST